MKHLFAPALVLSFSVGLGAAEKKERIFPKNIAPGAITSQEAAANVAKLAGGRVKLVWMHAETRTADGKPVRSHGPDNRAAKGRIIKGLDTAEGTYRTIMDDAARPIINARLTHDGQRVLWGDQATPEGATWVINWDGSGKRELCPGTVLCLRFDAANKRHLAYVWRPVMEKKGHNDLVAKSASLWEVPIDEPAAARQVLSKPLLSDWRGFSVSADGKWGGGVLEDPKIGLVNLGDGAWNSFTGGCYANIAPDNSYRLWHFVGGHRGIKVFDFGATDVKDKKRVRDIYIGEIPTATADPAMTGSFDGYGFLHPKWAANHAGFMVMTGPHRGMKLADGSKVGLPQNIELYFGRFNESFTEMTGWVQVTSDLANCFWPDAWVESSDATQQLTAAVAAAAPTAVPWPVDSTGSAFVYDRLDAPGNVADQNACAVSLRDRAFHGRGGVLDLAGGSAEPDAASTQRLLAAATAAKALTAELLLTPAKVPQRGEVLRIGTLRLHQDGDQLLLTTAAGSRPLAKLKTGTPVAVQMVCGANGQVRIDGKGVGNEANAAISSVTAFAAPVAFGGTWAGEVQRIHLAGATRSNEQLDRAATALRHAASARSAGKPIVIEAELLEIAAPDMSQMNSYRAWLGGNVYAVRKVVSGELKAERIIVMQFGILDQKPLNRPLKVGTRSTLTIEAWDDRPEVHATTVQDSSDPNLPVFLDPTR